MWRLIAVPVVGAVIGYATNWIAVKMLFRPHKEAYLLGRKLPFTPGVIPKGQGRLARAVGRAVESQLLTEEVLANVLLSEKMKEKVRKAAAGWEESRENSEATLWEAAVEIISEETAESFIREAEERLTDTICQKLKEMNPGRMIADKVLETAKEKLAESLFGSLIGDSFLEPIARLVEERINEYVDEYGRSCVEPMVQGESEKLQQKTVGGMFLMLRDNGLDIPSAAVSLYERLVREKLPDALAALDLARIVEDRINAMEVAEVEELLLAMMKKELGAVVNLGALIGFLLGLINVGILCM